MIYGVGTDIVQIARLQTALMRHGERFAAKILGPDELCIFHERRAKVDLRGIHYLATRFAAKEAFSKAIGLGLCLPMSWQNAQILSAPGGKPVLVTSGTLQEFMQQQRLRTHISITDETAFAVAFAVVEQDPITD